MRTDAKEKRIELSGEDLVELQITVMSLEKRVLTEAGKRDASLRTSYAICHAVYMMYADANGLFSPRPYVL